MGYPQTTSTVPDSGGPTRNQLIVVAVGAILLLVAALFATRALFGGTSAPDEPTGLSVNFDKARVAAIWNGSDGADSYILTRDDGVVVYAGPETKASDDTASQGKRSYRVQAVRQGVMSRATEDSTVEVGPTWGAAAPLVAQFPAMLPQSPDASGWRNVYCFPGIRANNDELGSGIGGSERLGNLARLTCRSSEVDALQVNWLASKEPIDAMYSKISSQPGAQPIKWRHGTGYVLEGPGEAYLRMDDHDTVHLLLRLRPKANKEQLVEAANDLPIDE